MPSAVDEPDLDDDDAHDGIQLAAVAAGDAGVEILVQAKIQ